MTPALAQLLFDAHDAYLAFEQIANASTTILACMLKPNHFQPNYVFSNFQRLAQLTYSQFPLINQTNNHMLQIEKQLKLERAQHADPTKTTTSDVLAGHLLPMSDTSRAIFTTWCYIMNFSADHVISAGNQEMARIIARAPYNIHNLVNTRLAAIINAAANLKNACYITLQQQHHLVRSLDDPVNNEPPPSPFQVPAILLIQNYIRKLDLEILALLTGRPIAQTPSTITPYLPSTALQDFVAGANQQQPSSNLRAAPPQQLPNNTSSNPDSNSPSSAAPSQPSQISPPVQSPSNPSPPTNTNTTPASSSQPTEDKTAASLQKGADRE